MSESRPIEVGFRKPPETARPGPTSRARVTKVSGGSATQREDLVATEEPCEILVEHGGAQHRIAVTMRTPGNDFELAVGFLFTEGLIRGRDDVAKVSYCASGPPEQLYNQVTVELVPGSSFDPSAVKRNFYTSSSCGVCGKASIESVHVHCERAPEGPAIDGAILPRLPDALRARQKVFERTGGLHAAGLFDPAGELLLAREDVGRHNAVDKLVGKLVLDGAVPARDRIMQVSGRASFEIVQKAAVAGIPIVSAVSAPSSLAVSLATDLGMTLVGFVRGDSYNVYAGSSRIRMTNSSSSGVSTSSSADGGAM
jgi:FdhD protein